MSIETREEWLNKMKDLMEPMFNQCGYKYPSKIQIAAGFCTSRKAVGQCFHPEKDDKPYNIFIDPSKWYSMDVAEVLCHELIHACLGSGKGHGKQFKDACRKLGLKPTKYTGATKEFVRWVRPLIDGLGKYPHVQIKRQSVKKKQPKLKIIKCQVCDFWVRIDVALLKKPRLKCPCCPDEVLMTKEERE